MPAVRADLWAEAAQDAAQYADPVAAQLVTFYRLLDPGAAGAAEIATFLAENPDWPFQSLLKQRLDLALETEPDNAVALRICTQHPPDAALAWLRCAAAEAAAGAGSNAEADAKKGWIEGDFTVSEEVAILARWGPFLTPSDQWQRFAHLAGSDSAAAARQLPRLAPDQQAAGGAWLGIAEAKPNAWGAYAALPAATRLTPGLYLAAARWLERQGYHDRALKLWQQEGDQVEHAAPAGERAGFWRERDILARDLLEIDRPKPAYALVAAPPAITRRDALSQQFLAGFIALRFLHAPNEAVPHFQALADASRAAITQGRAHYWLGRAYTAAGNTADAQAQYREAARWLTTYYGQLAALALGQTSAALDQRIRALRDPAWTAGQALRFASREVTRAAAFLVAWGEPRRARAFVLKLVELAPGPAMRSLAARLALGFGLPDQAVAASRLAGTFGEMLPQTGWPMPFEIADDGVDPAAVLGVIRQESSFDVAAASPSGALGLMQLMPATAERVARSLGERMTLAALTADPERNVTLGSTYLRSLLDRFDDCLPLALAAYNAGPNNVSNWLAENGDPRTGAIDMLDWIELIPYGETRDYVQRVIESVAIYQAKLNEDQPYPLARWLKH
ncbi:MAG: transglycosylase SLT domain-containing protein [Acetobacteraceae bacterium]